MTIVKAMTFLLLMISRNMILVLIFTAVFALGTAMIIPTLAAMVSRQAGSNTGVVLGIQNVANSLGQTMGPLAGGLLFTFPIYLPYLFTGILLLSSSALILKKIAGIRLELCQ